MAEDEEKILSALEDTLKVLTALRATLDDVGARVSRLREWIKLETYVLELSNSFAQFNDEVLRALGDAPQVTMANINPTTLSVLARLWANCRNRQLKDLDVTIAELRYLNKALASDPTSALELQTWLNELGDLEQKIQNALAQYAFIDLKDSCDKFNHSVTRRIGLHRQRMKQEIGVLAEVSIRLRTTLDVSLPHQAN